MTTMRAVQARAAGGPEVLELVERPIPEPGPGEVRIRLEAIGLNYIDTYQRAGLYPVKMPAVLGLEGAGVVDAVGPGVRLHKVGDRVAFGNGPLGAYAEFHVAPEDRVVALPDGLDARKAAAMMLKGMTAEFLLCRCYPVRPGDPVLIHAASGGVGQIMTQWAKALGAEVIGTVGSEAKAEVARRNGCDHLILYREEDVAERVKAITGGEGVAVVYDGIGAATFDGSLKSLRRRGMLVSFGNASGPVPPIQPLRLSQGGSLYLTRPTLFDYVATRAELEESASALFEVVTSGKVRIDIGQTFRLEEARRAHEALEARETTGSTLLLP